MLTGHREGHESSLASASAPRRVSAGWVAGGSVQREPKVCHAQRCVHLYARRAVQGEWQSLAYFGNGRQPTTDSGLGESGLGRLSRGKVIIERSEFRVLATFDDAGAAHDGTVPGFAIVIKARNGGTHAIPRARHA
jgi:hypothetical protein